MNPPDKIGFLQGRKDEHAKRKLEDLSRGFSRTISHLNEVSKLGDAAYKHQKLLFDAAIPGNDAEINKLARPQRNGLESNPQAAHKKKKKRS